MKEKENIVELYFSTLHKETNPSAHLVKFLCEVLEKTPETKDFINMNKLIKLYGRENVFFGILDLADVDIKERGYYGLLIYVIKKRIMAKQDDNTQASEDLTPYLEKLKKDLTRQLKRKDRDLE